MIMHLGTGLWVLRGNLVKFHISLSNWLETNKNMLSGIPKNKQVV